MTLSTIIQRRQALEATSRASGSDMDVRALDQEATQGTCTTWAEHQAQGEYLTDMLEAYALPPALVGALRRLIAAAPTLPQNEVRAAA